MSCTTRLWMVLLFGLSGCTKGSVSLAQDSAEGAQDSQQPGGEDSQAWGPGGDSEASGGEDSSPGPSDTESSGEDSDSSGSDSEAGDWEIDPAILGSWQRSISKGPKEAELTWTGSEDGSCQALLQQGPVTDRIDCLFTADGSTFTVDDFDCPVGEYAYDIDGDILTFSLLFEPCEGREFYLVGEWTRK